MAARLFGTPDDMPGLGFVGVTFGALNRLKLEESQGRGQYIKFMSVKTKQIRVVQERQ